MFAQFRFHSSSDAVALARSSGQVDADIRQPLCFACIQPEDFDRGDYSFDRGNYGQQAFEHIEMRVPRLGLAQHSEAEASRPADLTCDCRLIMKGRGGAPHSRDPLIVVTTCQIALESASAFLQQFETARDYLMDRPGFIRHHLFENCAGDPIYRFINVAEWRSMNDFTDAFASPDFKKLIKGGFDHTSQIILARPATSPINHRSIA